MSIAFFPFVFIVQLAVTLLISGAAFALQLGYYPLFQVLPSDLFDKVIDDHKKKMNPLFFALMLLELLTAIWTPFITEKLWIVVLLCIGLAILVVNWLITIFSQITMMRLKGGKSSGTAATLIQANWVRTILWLIRSVILLVIADWFVIKSYFSS